VDFEHRRYGLTVVVDGVTNTEENKDGSEQWSTEISQHSSCSVPSLFSVHSVSKITIPLTRWRFHLQSIGLGFLLVVGQMGWDPWGDASRSRRLGRYEQTWFPKTRH